jgi:hypothetical protein
VSRVRRERDAGWDDTARVEHSGVQLQSSLHFSSRLVNNQGDDSSHTQDAKQAVSIDAGKAANRPLSRPARRRRARRLKRMTTTDQSGNQPEESEVE